MTALQSHVCLQTQYSVEMSSVSLFKKSSIQPKFKNCTLIVAFCQYRDDISRIKSFEGKLFSTTCMRERKQDFTVLSYIKCWNKNYLLTCGLEASHLLGFSRKRGGGGAGRLKTWSFKASYMQNLHWHFSSVFINY